jgi:UDP-N-acetylmuramoyl-tripeptide--D-alanyl-D-alanine ligase
MIPITAKKLQEILGGQLIGSFESLLDGAVETDSRLIGPGGIFFAKPGEKEDGHDYVANAKDRGAKLAVVERRVEVSIDQLVVPNTVEALAELASWLISELRTIGGLAVIGITGSNGKTTTKNMLRAILSRAGETISPIESFNNRVGAPISVLRADSSTRYLVVEMGAEGPGSIKHLASMANPDIGVILKVGLAHAGEFGGIENTAAIKSELAKALSVGSKLVLNADDALVAKMQHDTQASVHWFGTVDSAEFSASEIQLTTTGTSFLLSWPDGESTKIELKILGEHHVFNALAASAVGSLLGIAKLEIISALEGLEVAERWRMQRLERPDGVVVINDAYNASPDSMKAALQTLAQLGRRGSRTIAVLGEMAELGEYSVAEHDAIGRLAVRLNIDQVVVIGKAAKLIHMGASQEGSWDGESLFFEDANTAKQFLDEFLSPGDTVLVKSSKSANLRFLGDELMGISN